MADSPDSSSSQLSDHGSDEFAEDVKMEDPEDEQEPEQEQEQGHLRDPRDLEDGVDDSPIHTLPPAKKRRTGQYSHQSTPIPLVEAPAEDLGDISSDTEGSIPSSPTGDDKFRMPDEDPMAHEQVTVCKWEGCPAGDLGNMDKLVQHLQDDHVAGKQTSYACEWYDCQRKGQAHASGYALKAHMRSHTKEKPFYCALPECDRSFTRSDALAKHMRTVHETEALRPSDPVPRHYSSAHFKPQRLKLVLNAKPPMSQSEGSDKETAASIEPHADLEAEDLATAADTPTQAEDGGPLPPLSAAAVAQGSYEYPDDVHFTEEELTMPPDALYKLLRRQVHWAREEGKELLEEVKVMEVQRKEEWMAKELVLANVIEAELATAHTRSAISEGNMARILDDLPPNPLPMTGEEAPWYRRPVS